IVAPRALHAGASSRLAALASGMRKSLRSTRALIVAPRARSTPAHQVGSLHSPPGCENPSVPRACSSAEDPALEVVLVRLGGGQRVGGDDGAVLHRRLLEHALLRGVVDPDDAEALAIALLPFVVVEERPDEVAGERHAFARGVEGGGEVRVQKALALEVVHAAVLVGRGVVGGAVLGDV